MAFTLFIYILLFHHVFGERGGITHCSSVNVPITDPHGLTASAGGATGGFLMQDGDFMFGCCGVIETLKTKGTAGDLALQVWRQTGADEFTLISQKNLVAADFTGSGSLTSNLDYGTRVSFQEGDILGWTSSSDLVQRATDGSVHLNRNDAGLGASIVGDTHTWNSQDVENNVRYAIQAVTTESTPPYFKNLPALLVYADTELAISGITLLTLEVSDVDPDDVGGLTIEMNEAYDDRFQLTSGVVTTSVKFEPGTYEAKFRVEESHCGQTGTGTLTVSVTDSPPSITNLPASANVHEDMLDETLLYTVTTSDPMNQAIWCDGDWDVGTTAGTQKPYIVKMLSTAGGDSRAGIYLIEWPLLDYDVKAQIYDLSITCTDPAGNTATGNFHVNIIKNQLPIFSNLGNMVQVDATTALVGDVIFTVSTTDVENDQVTYAYTCSPASTGDGNCPLTVYDSGEVVLTGNVYLWNTFSYTLSITASDLRDTTAARTLIVYIINYNNDPVLTNVAGTTENVTENSALGRTVFQASATDADSTDTVTFWMVINPEEGWNYLQMSSGGLLTTHSTNNINYESLAATSFTVTVYAHDGKEYVTADLTVTVIDVNEGVTFRQPGYSATRTEGSSGDAFPSAYIDVIDPDASETHTYSMNCATYDAYFSLDPTTAIASFAQDYDLDIGNLPTEVCCSIYVVDSVGHNDTAELCLIIEYTENNTPVVNPTSYAVTVRSDTARGNRIVQVTATDGDRSVHGELSYTLDQTSLGGTYLMIDTDGSIYANQVLTSLASAGTKTVVVTVTDGTTPIIVNVVITFEDATVVPVVVDDRDRKFIEDTRNVAWITIMSLALASCLFVIILIIVRYCMARKEPFFKNCFKPPEPRRKRELDKKRRPKPFPRQTAPEYRHVHANEILRHTPLVVATPEPVGDTYSVRPTSGASRVTVSQVDYQEDTDRDPNEWMYYDTDAKSLPPSRVVSRVRSGDKEYINGGRRSSRHVSKNSMPFGDIPVIKTPDEIARQSSPLRVTPSPIAFDNSNNNSNQDYHDDDDFRSERLSIAAEDPTPLPRPSGSNLDQW